MVELRTVQALMVQPAFAASVVGPAYDALLPEERRRLADANPDSFFNVVRSAADHPGEDEEELLQRNVRALRRLVDTGRYRARAPGLFLYRLVSPSHRQTAVIGDLPVRQVLEGGVRAHEHTRVVKEAELARHLAHLGMHSSPVGLGYRAHADIDELVLRLTQATADLDFVTSDGLIQQVWAITDPDDVGGLQAAFASVASTYIIDGHHRVAAASRIDGGGSFLAALIPDHELRLLAYHRMVAGPLPEDLSRRLGRLGSHYRVVANPEGPQRRRTAGPPASEGGGSVPLLAFDLYAAGRWYALLRQGPRDDRLAAAVADEELLGPLFDIVDPRRDPRLAYVAGQREPDEIAALAQAEGGAALLLPAPSVADVFEQVDRGQTLPPKSTWFEPKLRSGIFVVWR